MLHLPSLKNPGGGSTVSNSKRVCRLWLKINDKDLFMSVRVCEVDTQLVKTQKCSEEQRKSIL